jgi:hypothetical protein
MLWLLAFGMVAQAAVGARLAKELSALPEANQKELLDFYTAMGEADKLRRDAYKKLSESSKLWIKERKERRKMEAQKRQVARTDRPALQVQTEASGREPGSRSQ